MKLLFINELGPNYKNENIYEFIFGDKIEEIWNGNLEKERLKTEYFGLGDLEVSYNDTRKRTLLLSYYRRVYLICL